MGNETLGQHQAQQAKHIEDHLHEEDQRLKEHEHRATHSTHEIIGDEIAHEKKAERRQQDETDAALAETANTVFREE